MMDRFWAHLTPAQAASGAAVLLSFGLGYLCAPGPAPRSEICAPELAALETCREQQTTERGRCIGKITEAQGACVEREREACERRGATLRAVQGSLDCAICDAERRARGGE